MESPQKALEVLGIGKEARKSKTYIDSMRAAFILSRIRTHLRMLIDMLARAHARHHSVPVKVVEDGEEVIRYEPEWLTDQQVIDRYSAARAWHEAHQEIVDHNPSVEGFSIKSTMHVPDEESKRKAESSAGSESGNDRW